MNVNTIIEPIGRLLEWSFANVIEPLGNSVNYSVVVLGFVGLFVWLKMQSDYNKKAKQDGSIQ